VAEINIPTGPLDREPYQAITPGPGKSWNDSDVDMADANHHALDLALNGVELGAFDRTVLRWLAHYEPHTVATVCSLILRARAAETEGKVVLDEVAEMGLQYDDGRDEVAIVDDEIVVYTRRAYWLRFTPAEADERAAHLATMARALRTREAGQ
jgi:hypothetical protein